MKRIFLFISLCFLLVSCTDSQKANISSLGKKHKVTMYNGGILVREWISTGKVTSLSSSDGWQFVDQKTGKFIRVGGDVIIEVVE